MELIIGMIIIDKIMIVLYNLFIIKTEQETRKNITIIYPKNNVVLLFTFAMIEMMMELIIDLMMIDKIMIEMMMEMIIYP